jgi:nitrogen fixation-related uncharacterized protein
MISFSSIMVMISIIVIVIGMRYYLWPKIQEYNRIF